MARFMVFDLPVFEDEVQDHIGFGKNKAKGNEKD